MPRLKDSKNKVGNIEKPSEKPVETPVEKPIETPDIIQVLDEVLNYALEMNEHSFGIMYGADGEQKKIIGNRYVNYDIGLWVEAELQARASRIKADKLKINIINK